MHCPPCVTQLSLSKDILGNRSYTHTPFPVGRGSFAFSIKIRLSSWNRIVALLWSLSLNLQRRKIRQQLRKQVLRFALLEKQLCHSIYQLSHALLTLSNLCLHTVQLLL